METLAFRVVALNIRAMSPSIDSFAHQWLFSARYHSSRLLSFSFSAEDASNGEPNLDSNELENPVLPGKFAQRQRKTYDSILKNLTVMHVGCKRQLEPVWSA